MNKKTEQDNNTVDYPGVFQRVKAGAIDGALIVLFIILVTLIFSNFKDVPNIARIVAFTLIFGIYDPLLTSLFGGTIGHMAREIRVKRESDSSKNLIFPKAFIRSATKYLLGWFSLLTMSINSNNSAIHDLVVGSVVIWKDKKPN